MMSRDLWCVALQKVFRLKVNKNFNNISINLQRNEHELFTFCLATTGFSEFTFG